MRRSEEQLGEILRRSARIRKRREAAGRLALNAASTCVCLALLLLSALCFPRLSREAERLGAARYGSLILDVPHLGYVMVGLFAFLLGVCVVLLCVHWKAWREEERHEA